MVSFIYLLIGLALLVGGAHFAVHSSSRLASSLGVPPLVVGMTLVAFGTGLPELVLNTASAWSGITSLAFGNLVGASTLNVTFVLGITAIIRPITVRKSVVTREIPLMILASLALIALSSDSILGHYPVNLLDRADGIVLMLFFSVFLYYTIFELATRAEPDPFVEEVRQQGLRENRENGKILFITLIAGLLGVVLGARLTLDGAVAIAQSLGISESVIGLTLVSFGTTLPELTTCIIAARRGHHDLVLGNLVGSNILNLLCFFGIISLVHPIPVPEYGLFDLIFLSSLCLGLAPIAIRGPMRISRGEGAALLSFYLVGTLFRVFFLHS